MKRTRKVSHYFWRNNRKLNRFERVFGRKVNLGNFKGDFFVYHQIDKISGEDCDYGLRICEGRTGAAFPGTIFVDNLKESRNIAIQELSDNKKIFEKCCLRYIKKYGLSPRYTFE